jgi:small-conductance mechanosensitive channel
MLELPKFVAGELFAAGTTFIASLIIALAIVVALEKVFLRITRRTKTELDDRIIALLKGPVFCSILLLGLSLSLARITLIQGVYLYLEKGINTVLVLIWIVAAQRIAKLVLAELERKLERAKARLLPLTQNMLTVILYFIGFILILSVWDVDITPFLASAGILGLALGFAAKDSLANLFGGVTILLDKPYKVGDVIQFDGEIGEVLNIGLRSTLLRTRDNVQISVPNSITASSKIINLSMPRKKIRLRVKIGVAYGSNVAKVKKVLLDIAKKNPNVLEDPEPVVRFLEFGDSALLFELRCWVHEPFEMRKVLDEINTEIDKRFREAKIEIPFPQRDIHIRD